MVKTRSAGSIPYPVIKEDSRRHFLNSLFSDGGSWLFGTGGGSAGLVCPVAFIDIAPYNPRPATLGRPNAATGANTQRRSTSTLGSAHVFVDNVHSCALSRSSS